MTDSQTETATPEQLDRLTDLEGRADRLEELEGRVNSLDDADMAARAGAATPEGRGEVDEAGIPITHHDGGVPVDEAGQPR
jgi:hypothetical protein